MFQYIIVWSIKPRPFNLMSTYTEEHDFHIILMPFLFDSKYSGHCRSPLELTSPGIFPLSRGFSVATRAAPWGTEWVEGTRAGKRP